MPLCSCASRVTQTPTPTAAVTPSNTPAPAPTQAPTPTATTTNTSTPIPTSIPGYRLLTPGNSMKLNSTGKEPPLHGKPCRGSQLQIGNHLAVKASCLFFGTNNTSRDHYLSGAKLGSAKYNQEPKWSDGRVRGNYLKPLFAHR